VNQLPGPVVGELGRRVQRLRLRMASLVTASMMATARAASPRIWAVTVGVPSGRAEVSAAGFAEPVLR
jgi:hypothetical protein